MLQKYDLLLDKISEYLEAGQYHMLFENLRIAVELLPKVETDEKQQQKLGNLLCVILPILDTQAKELIWHNSLRDIGIAAYKIIKSQELAVINYKLDIHVKYSDVLCVREWTDLLDAETLLKIIRKKQKFIADAGKSQSTKLELLKENLLLTLGQAKPKNANQAIPCAEEILQITRDEILTLADLTEQFHKDLKHYRTNSYQPLINIIGNYYLLEAVFKYYAVVALQKLPAMQIERYRKILAKWIESYITQLLQLDGYIATLQPSKQKDFDAIRERCWCIVHQYHRLLKITEEFTGADALELLRQTARSTFIEKNNALQQALSLLKKSKRNHIEILNEVLNINKAVITPAPVIFDCLQFRERLTTERTSFSAELTIDSQKRFSDFSKELLRRFFSMSMELLGFEPCAVSLLLFGSSSRLDRMPYSDLEVVLLHSELTAIHSQHVPVNIYCALLHKLLSYVIISLGETNYQNINEIEGYRLDDSTGGIKIGTVSHIANDLIITKLTTNDEGGNSMDYIHALQNECVYMLLNPVLVNTDTGTALFKDYQICIKTFLNSNAPNEDWQRFIIKFQLPFTVPPPNLTYRQLIAYYCFFNVVCSSEKPVDKADLDIIDLKNNYYKPIVYLALNLRLYYDLQSVHPADILKEAKKRRDELKVQDYYQLFPWDLLPFYRRAIPKLLTIRAFQHSKHQKQIEKISKMTLPASQITVLDNIEPLLEILTYDRDPTNYKNNALVLLPLKTHFNLLLQVDFTFKITEISILLNSIKPSDSGGSIKLTHHDFLVIYDLATTLKIYYMHLTDFNKVFQFWNDGFLKTTDKLLKELKDWLDNLQLSSAEQSDVSLYDRMVNQSDLQKRDKMLLKKKDLITDLQMRCKNIPYCEIDQNCEIDQKNRDDFNVVFTAITWRYIYFLLFTKQFKILQQVYLLLSRKLRKMCQDIIQSFRDKIDLTEIDDLLKSCPNPNGHRPGVDDVRKAFERGLISALIDRESQANVRIHGAGFFVGEFQGNLCTQAAEQLQNVARELALPKPSDDNDHNHLVKEINVDGMVYYFKFFPEIPGYELAVSRLYDLMIGGMIVKSVLTKITIKGHDYPVLISEKIVGYRLDVYLKEAKNPIAPDKIFTQLFLMRIFTMPEDDKPNNSVWRTLISDKGTPGNAGIPIGIDNDRVFIKPIYEEMRFYFNSKVIINLKSVIFCFQQMNAGLNKDAVNEFLELNPKEVLQHLVSDLERYRNNLKSVFTSEQIQKWSKTEIEKNKYHQQSFAYVQLPADIMRIIDENMTILQEILSNNFKQTHFEVLQTLLPKELQDYYGNLFKNLETTKQRFNKISVDFYNGNASTLPPTLALSQSHSKPLTLKNATSATCDSLNECQKYLDSVTTHCQLLTVVKISAEQGNLELLNKLPEILQLKAINLLRWENIKLAVQKKILQILLNQKDKKLCTILSFSHCLALTDDLLSKLLGAKFNLQTLKLDHCDGIANLSLLKKLPRTALQSLYLIRINNCLNLQQLSMPSLPLLTYLRLKNCNLLQIIKVNEDVIFSKLTDLRISGCPVLVENKILLPIVSIPMLTHYLCDNEVIQISKNVKSLTLGNAKTFYKICIAGSCIRYATSILGKIFSPNVSSLFYTPGIDVYQMNIMNDNIKYPMRFCRFFDGMCVFPESCNDPVFFRNASLSIVFFNIEQSFSYSDLLIDDFESNLHFMYSRFRNAEEVPVLLLGFAKGELSSETMSAILRYKKEYEIQYHIVLSWNNLSSEQEKCSIDFINKIILAIVLHDYKKERQLLIDFWHTIEGNVNPDSVATTRQINTNFISIGLSDESSNIYETTRLFRDLIESTDNKFLFGLANQEYWNSIRWLFSHGFSFDDRRTFLQKKNNDGDTVLSLAARDGDFQVITCLIEDFKYSDIHVCNKHGFTALDLAIVCNHSSVAKYLRSIKATSQTNISAATYPLHYAVIYDYQNVPTLLATATMADMKPDENGNTPLHLAAGFGRSEEVSLLLSKFKGVPEQRNKFGCTPLNLAMMRSEHGFPAKAQIVNILLQDPPAKLVISKPEPPVVYFGNCPNLPPELALKILDSINTKNQIERKCFGLLPKVSRSWYSLFQEDNLKEKYGITKKAWRSQCRMDNIY